MSDQANRERADEFAMRILPRGTKMSAMNLTDTREAIAKAFLPFVALEHELFLARGRIGELEREVAEHNRREF